ncbi:MAG: hypothetical protein LBG72_04435 [Spirochaetaceae bacterium]|jgi:tetratricopeptide (TPR) repeat protein|nr:hypothetical protein [Spirochaetaceae bacterium]
MAELSPVDGFIRKAYEHLKEGKPVEGRKALEDALKVDFEHPEVLYALKCLGWWLEKFAALDEDESAYSRGVNILSWWNFYYVFLDKIEGNFDSCQYAIRRFVYSAALNALLDVQNDGELRHDPELLLFLGRCYKGLGDYENAAAYLGKAAGWRREDAAALAEFADVKALLGDVSAAKALFREAFFINPQAVNLCAMESELLQNLVRYTAKEGKEGAAINEWLPVYGALTGVFSVERNLNRLEVSKLEQSIKALENDLRAGAKNQDELLPRLLNRYLRLMKHYEKNNNAAGVSEIILKIRIYDDKLYERHKNYLS